MSPVCHARYLGGVGFRRIALLLPLVILAMPAAAANEILRAGAWEGTYLPPSSGDLITADFMVEKGERGEEMQWTVSMSLRLPAPVNKPRAFLEIKSDAGELRFTVDMQPQLLCRLHADEFGELSGQCYEKAWGEGPSATMSMKPPTPIAAEEEAGPGEPGQITD